MKHKKLAIRDEFALYTIVCEYITKKGSLITAEQKSELLSHVRYRFCTFAELETITENPAVPAPILVEALMTRLKPYELAKEANSGDKNRPFQRPNTSNQTASSTPSLHGDKPSTPTLMTPATAPHSLSSSPVGSSAFITTILVSSTPLPITRSTKSPQASPSVARARLVHDFPIVCCNYLKSYRSPDNAQRNLLESRVDEDDLFVKTALDESTTIEGDEKALPLRLRVRLHPTFYYLPHYLQPRPKFDVVFDFYPGTAFFKGVIGWIATNYGRSDWKNPHLSGIFYIIIVIFVT